MFDSPLTVAPPALPATATMFERPRPPGGKRRAQKRGPSIAMDDVAILDIDSMLCCLEVGAEDLHLPANDPESPQALPSLSPRENLSVEEKKICAASKEIDYGYLSTQHNESATYMSAHIQDVLSKEIMANKVVEVKFYKETLGLVLKRPMDSVVTLGKPILVKEVKSDSEAYEPLMNAFTAEGEKSAIDSFTAEGGKSATDSSSKSSAASWLLCEINGNNVSNLSYQRVLGLIRHGQRPSTAKFKPLNSIEKDAPIFCAVCAQYSCHSRSKSKQKVQFCKGLCATLLNENHGTNNYLVSDEMMWSAPLGGYKEFDMNIDYTPKADDMTGNQWWRDLYTRLQLLTDTETISNRGISTWCSMNKRDSDSFCLSIQGSKADKTIGGTSSTKTSTFQLAGASVYCYATSSTPWSVKNESLFSKGCARPLSPRYTRKSHTTVMNQNFETNPKGKHIRKAESECSSKSFEDFQLVNFERSCDVNNTLENSGGSNASRSASGEEQLSDKVEISIKVPRSQSARSSSTSVNSIRSTSSNKSIDWPLSSNGMLQPTFDFDERDDDSIFETCSFQPRKGEEQISKMPSKAHKLLIGNDRDKMPSSKKTRTARRWSVVKKRQSRRARLLFHIASLVGKKATTPALKDRQNNDPVKRSSILFDEISDAIVADTSSEPCMSVGNYPHTTELNGCRETYPIDQARKEMGGLREMTVAILLPKCKSLNRTHGKVLLLRVRTKKEASNLTTTIKRNIFAANAQALLKASRENDSERLSELMGELMSNDDVQPIRKDACCEVIGKRAIEEIIKHDNLECLKNLLEQLKQ